MSVHIGELHTDVVPTGVTAESSRSGTPEPEWVGQERLMQARTRTEWLRRRVCAEGFDD
jgi:hypothetical protein